MFDFSKSITGNARSRWISASIWFPPPRLGLPNHKDAHAAAAAIHAAFIPEILIKLTMEEVKIK